MRQGLVLIEILIILSVKAYSASGASFLGARPLKKITKGSKDEITILLLELQV